MKMTLTSYLAGLEAATSAEALEVAIQAPFSHAFRGRTWSRICEVRVRVGLAICDANPFGRFVPRFGPGRCLTVCGESYKVGRGQNGAGVRYVWHFAGEWAKEVLQRNGLSVRASHRLWESWRDYPHRCLALLEDALAGKIPDPVLGELHRHDPRYCSGQPIRYSVAENDAPNGDRRATRRCPCGGTLFDWGGGHSEGFEYVNWRCESCPDVFTEYMSAEQFRDLRTLARGAAA